MPTGFDTVDALDVCSKLMAEAGFSVCHCSVSSAVGLGDTPGNTLLAEQWHTAALNAMIPAHTLNKHTSACRL